MWIQEINDIEEQCKNLPPGHKVNSQSFIAAATQMFELALETCSHECTTVRSSADLRIKFMKAFKFGVRTIVLIASSV